MQDDLDMARCHLAPDDVFHAPGEEDLPLDPRRTVNETIGLLRTLGVEWELTAKVRYCVVCPVTNACLVRGWSETDGIYGGLTPSDRKKIQEGGTVGIDPAKVHPISSPQRDKVVQLMRDGEDINTISLKTGARRVAVYRYLREYLALSL